MLRRSFVKILLPFLAVLLMSAPPADGQGQTCTYRKVCMYHSSRFLACKFLRHNIDVPAALFLNTYIYLLLFFCAEVAAFHSHLCRSAHRSSRGLICVLFGAENAAQLYVSERQTLAYSIFTTNKYATSFCGLFVFFSVFGLPLLFRSSSWTWPS